MISIEQVTLVSIVPSSAKDSVSPIVLDAISKYHFDLEFRNDSFLPGEHVIDHFEDDPQIAQAVRNWFKSLNLDPEKTLIHYWW